MSRKAIFLIFICLISSITFAQNYTMVKVLDINQGKNENEIHLRAKDDVGPSDDRTGNYLVVSDNGNIYIQDDDNGKVCKVDIDSKKIIKIFDNNVLDDPYENLQTVLADGALFFADSNGRFEKFSSDGKKIFSVIFFNYDMIVDSYEKYYDEESNIIFATNGKKELYCILNPTMDQEQNKKNYRDPVQTKAMIDNQEFGSHISFYNNKYLIIDNLITPWNTVWHGKFRYQIVDMYYITLWDGAIKSIKFDKKENEIVESTAIHPSGDIYRLIYNTASQVHTLYKVENTWDPAWRKQWYKEHK